MLLLLIVFMMIIPLPAEVLDFLISLNLSLALVVLLSTLSIQRALDFSSFPSLLVVTTLFRLALNVSSARLILLNGFAGYVINAFGSFVVGGNVVVGVIVFLILVVIQYIVITRGAERVSEVAARFTLDAMPGKQMAIDADLNAGLIDETEARRRRQEIQRQADFYGAMDGASKFVRGDAIAGMVILAVNIVGGLIIGVAMNGLPIGVAVERYTILTVGDGLVSQIPALLLSTATGLIVTRSSEDAQLARSMATEVLGQPRVLHWTAAVLGVMGIVPGMPLLPLWTLAAGFLALGRLMTRRPIAQPAPKPVSPRPATTQELTEAMRVDPVALELGLSCLPLAGEDGPIIGRIVNLRRQIALELGLVVPPVRVRDNLELPADGYAILLRGAEVARGQVKVGWYLAIDASRQKPEPAGVKAREPVFGIPAYWVGPEQRLRLEAEGFTVVDAPTVIVTHLSEVVRAHAPELLTRQEVQRLLDEIRKESPALVEDLMAQVQLGDVQRVLRALLRERVSIRDLPLILEALADAARESSDFDAWVGQVRQALGRSIARQVGLADGRAKAVTLAAETERRLLEALAEGGVPPATQEALQRAVAQELRRAAEGGYELVLLCSARVRPLVRRIVERTYPRLSVLAFSEIQSGMDVETVGVVAL